jgi:phosphinothricin acetyltransferase
VAAQLGTPAPALPVVSSDRGPAGDRGRVRGAWKARDAYLWTVESTVYVDHECHRRGVGDALYAELLARLERQGFRTSIGVIALPNPASVRLHERHGFVEVGLLADAGYKLKRWHDVGFWQRRLNGGEQAPPTLTPVDDDGCGV